MTTRRTFLKVMGAAGGGLVLGVGFAEGAGETATAFRPNAWVEIHPDGTVLVRIGKSEMGQGVRTSLPMALAEELDADFSKIRIEQASPGPDFRGLGTGGSGSTMRLWDPLRQAGAAARAMLVGAAAAKWGLDGAMLKTRDGWVVDPASGRMASYGDLAADAARQPVPAEPPLKNRKDYRLIGRSMKRLDGPDIVTGRARYGVDVRVPGMKYAVVARAPRLGGSVASWNGDAAKRVPGVHSVVEIPSGIAVVADSTWSALRGRDALTIEWNEGPNTGFDSDRHMEALEKATREPGIPIRTDGEGRAAIERASKTIDAFYSYPFAAHASLEPVNCTVFVKDDGATVWSPTQTPNGVHAVVAHVLEMPPEAIKVNVTLLGGGFGRRLGYDFDREAAEIARRVKGTPVQLVWTREDDMKHGYFQAASGHRLAAALDDSGKIVGWEHRKASTPHQARRVPTPEQLRDPEFVRGSSWGVYDTPYAFPAVAMSYAVVEAPVPIGPWRSVFSPSSVFAREAFLDEVAQQTGRDPLELRLALLGEGDDSIEKVFTIAGDTIDRPRLRKVLETVAAKSGWGGALPAGRARGLACNVFHTETYIAYVVEVSLRRDARADQLPFRVDRVVCAIDCGVAVNPDGVAQQVESGVLWSLSNMKSAITVREGRVQESNYAEFPVVMMDETPRVIETHIVDSGDDRPHGIGEPTVCPLAPAVANALSRLVGKRIRKLPVRAADLA